MSELSLGVRRRGQHRFHVFTIFNVLSFNFLSGSIITLYALRLGADALFVGLLAALVHVAELMPPLAKRLVPRFGAVKVMGVAWACRYLAMIPLFLAPFAMKTGGGAPVGLVLCVVSVLGFNVSRGVGITSNNPIIGAITSAQDRGRFLSNNQLIIQILGIATGVVTALMLHTDSETGVFERYSIIMGVGIVAGLVASGVLLGLPEPMEARKSARTPLLESLARTVRKGGLGRFVVVQSLATVILNMAGPFLVVLLKRGFLLGDETVVFYTVMGSLGAIATALLGGMMLDRFGSKPFTFIFTALVAASLTLVFAAPRSGDGPTFRLVVGALYFFYTMGAAGMSTSLSTYFFSLVDTSERLNLGIVYFLVAGVAGGAGSLLGGFVLRALQEVRGLGDLSNGLPAFRLYFGCLAGALGLLLPLILTLERLGSRDVRDVLSTLVSLRDLRAIILLGRLARSSDHGDERRVIRALGEASSGLPREELLQRLASPMLSIRMDALTALTSVPLDGGIERALASEVRNHRFTTAHVAAEIIGNRGVGRAVPALRDALRSPDYMLQAKAMVALAQLGDSRSLPAVRDIVARTDNPRLLIYGAQALETMGGAEEIPVLLARIGRRQQPFVRDELILCVAGILGFKRVFYAWYTQFLSRGLLGLSAVRDFMQERILARASASVSLEVLSLVLEESTSGGEGFAEAVRQALAFARIAPGASDVTGTFLESLEDEGLVKLERYRFLLAATVVWFAFDSEHASS
jgi:MFS family permease